MGTPDARCGLIAGVQHGCISLDQAVRCGLSDDAVYRRTLDARWRRVLPRVYVLGGSPETWKQKLWAAVLWCGPGAALSGASAAALWQFPGFAEGPVEVSYPGAKKSRPGLDVHRARLDPLEVTSLEALPVTTPARTLFDVATRIDGRAFDVAFHHCLHHRLAADADLEGMIRRHPRRQGTVRLREGLDAYAAGGSPAASPLEARLARRIARSDVPQPVRQHQVRVRGRRRYLDFAWPRERVAVEVDGYRWHASRAAWENDRARLRDLRRDGWTILQATYDDVEVGFEALLADIRRALSQHPR